MRRIEPWLMARWKARVELLLSVIERLFLLRRYKAKCVKIRCFQEGVGHLEPKFQGGGVVPPANVLIPLEKQLIALKYCR